MPGASLPAAATCSAGRNRFERGPGRAYFFVAAGQAIQARRKGDTSAAPPSTVTLTKAATAGGAKTGAAKNTNAAVPTGSVKATKAATKPVSSASGAAQTADAAPTASAQSAGPLAQPKPRTDAGP